MNSSPPPHPSVSPTFYHPSNTFTVQANVSDAAIYSQAARDPQLFWAEWAAQLLWSEPWHTVLEWHPPHARWFDGGKLNACVNCVDRHVLPRYGGTMAKKVALYWEGEPGDQRQLTYQELYEHVNHAALVLQTLGVQRGDRVALYLPLLPETIIASLACARLGAIHSVVFAGLGASSLKARIKDVGATVVITADFGWRRGKLLPLKATVDEALATLSSVRHVLVVQRNRGKNHQPQLSLVSQRDVWWHEAMAKVSGACPPAIMDAEDTLFVLYTSGTTGKPKGIVHTTGGYLTGVLATTQAVFDLKPNDVYWCTADLGWITGHSYVLYGPLALGASLVLYEGALDWPDPGRFWQLIEKYGVTILYTAPTAIRSFMKWGPEWIAPANITSLRLLGSVGEPINPTVWQWYHHYVGQSRCPIVDTWWQTETGAIMATALPGISPLKPGSATRSFPGIDLAVVDETGQSVHNAPGHLVIRQPWPAMARDILNDTARYETEYWGRWPLPLYWTGDGARIDDDGYLWLLGRVDDVMNVAGHRLSPAEIESALVQHSSVSEAAVVAAPDQIKGEAIIAFVTLRHHAVASAELEAELQYHVAHDIGPIARPKHVVMVTELPKTRSGKIMRRLLRNIVNGQPPGDTTSLTNPAIVASLRHQFESMAESRH